VGVTPLIRLTCHLGCRVVSLRNHPCQISCRSVKGFLGGRTTKSAISYTYWNDPYNSPALPCMVVQAVVKATSQSNWKGQILTPWGSETPARISMKHGLYNQVAGMPTHANPCGAATTWVVWANTWKNTCCKFLRYTFLKFFCFILRLAPSPHKWTDFDDLYVIRRVSAQGGSRLYCSHFGGKSPKKLYFGYVNTHFQAERAKY